MKDYKILLSSEICHFIDGQEIMLKKISIQISFFLFFSFTGEVVASQTALKLKIKSNR